MTIGPEPRIRMDLRSWRRGIRGGGLQRNGSPRQSRNRGPSAARCALGADAAEAVGAPQQLVEVPDAAFAPRAQAAGLVGSRCQAALHLFADADVLLLHLVAERL